MQWELLSKTDAAQITSKWQGMSTETFAQMVSDWDTSIPGMLNDDYKSLRGELVLAYRKAKDEADNNPDMRLKKDYYKDLKFALYLYSILKKYDFSVRLASNDQVWIYLCVNVCPDIVHNRYPGNRIKTSEGYIFRNVNEDRFWKTRRRIYLKVLWWYVYLSMQVDEMGQEDLEKTYNVLKDNSTDEIVQIVERSGLAGYRVDVYRELISYYAQNRDKYDSKRFRHVMVLNTARTQLVEPSLMTGGIKAYVRELFKYFDE